MRAALLLLAGTCGCLARQPARPVGPALKRVVSYRFSSELHKEFKSYVLRCTRLVLDEEVLRAADGRELAIVATIIDGDHETCGVGAKVRLSASATRNDAVGISADKSLEYSTSERIRALHAQLGSTPSSLTFMNAAFPWKQPTKTVFVGGTAYLDAGFDSSIASGGPGLGESTLKTTLRVRASDHAVACASLTLTARGYGETGHAWSRVETESVAVDHGDGAPPCP